MKNKSTKSRFFYGWVVVAIGFLTYGLGFGIWYSFTFFFVAFLDEFKASRADTALAFSVFLLAQGLAGPLFGVLVERFGVRPVMALGGIFLTVSLALTSQTTALWQYYITFGLMTSLGVGAIGNTPNYAALNRWFAKRRGLAIGIAMAGSGALGISVLVPFNQYLIASFGWRSAYLVLAVLTLVVPPVVYFLQREHPQDEGWLPDGADAPADGGDNPETNGSDTGTSLAKSKHWQRNDWTLGRAVRKWQFWVLLAVFIVSPVANQMVFAHQAAYLVGIGHSPAAIATALSLLGFASIVGKVGWGAVSDGIGREIAYSIGMSCMIVALALLIAMPGLAGLWSLTIYAIAYGLGSAANASVQPAVTGDFFAGGRAVVIYSVLSVGGTLGAASGVWAAGHIFDLTGSYAWAFFSAGLCVVAAVAGIWLLAPRRIRASAFRTRGATP